MTAATIPSGIADTDYIAFGLAHCYTMDEGHLEDYWVFEPLTGATLECITGVSYENFGVAHLLGAFVCRPRFQSVLCNTKITEPMSCPGSNDFIQKGHGALRRGRYLGRRRCSNRCAKSRHQQELVTLKTCVVHSHVLGSRWVAGPCYSMASFDPFFVHTGINMEALAPLLDGEDIYAHLCEDALTVVYPTLLSITMHFLLFPPYILTRHCACKCFYWTGVNFLCSEHWRQVAQWSEGQSLRCVRVSVCICSARVLSETGNFLVFFLYQGLMNVSSCSCYALPKNVVNRNIVCFVRTDITDMAQSIKIGEVKGGFNFQPNVHKRVLNAVSEVNDDDNVKQDISIDVYGRQKSSGMGEIV